MSRDEPVNLARFLERNQLRLSFALLCSPLNASSHGKATSTLTTRSSATSPRKNRHRRPYLSQTLPRSPFGKILLLLRHRFCTGRCAGERGEELVRYGVDEARLAQAAGCTGASFHPVPLSARKPTRAHFRFLSQRSFHSSPSALAKNPYSVLGVSKDAKASDIKKNYYQVCPPLPAAFAFPLLTLAPHSSPRSTTPTRARRRMRRSASLRFRRPTMCVFSPFSLFRPLRLTFPCFLDPLRREEARRL